MTAKSDTDKSRIIRMICNTCKTWRDVVKGKCIKCGERVQPAATCIFLTDIGGHHYDCYRPPRPRNMSPVAYLRKYGCVDKQYTRMTNGRYYCNPAHCSKSWKNKKTRDEHLKMAYGALG